MGTEVASLFGVIELEDRLTPALRNARGSLDSFGGQLERIGGGLVGFGGMMTALTAPIAAVGLAGLKAASDFENVLVQLKTFGGLGASELETVRQAALQMGADTMFSASDAADAMLELAKSGFTVTDAMTASADVLNLAAVGEMDMAEAAGVVSTALAQFGLEAGDAAEAVDLLAAGALASRADVRSLAEGLGNVGPVAKQFGLSLEDTIATLGVFSNAGIEGAEAGTQLKSLLLNMSSDRAQTAFNELGVSLYDASGNARNFDTVIGDLDSALSGMSVEDQNRLMKDLAGAYGITGLSALLAADGIDAMQAAMGEAPGAAAMAQAAMSTFSGVLEGLKGSIETLLITALMPLMNDVLTPLASSVTKVVNAMTAWANANPALTSQIVKIGGALLVLFPTLVAIGGVMVALSHTAALASVGLGVLLNPLIAIPLAIGTFLAAGDTLGRFLQDIGDAADWARGGLQELQGGLKLLEVGEDYGMVFVRQGLRDIGSALLSIPVSLLSNLAGAFENITGIDLSALGGQISSAFENLTGIDTSALGAAISNAVNSVTGFDFSGLTTALTNNLDLAINVGLSALAIVAGGPLAIGIGLAKLVASAIATDFLGIGTFLQQSGIAESIEGAFETVKAQIAGAIQSVFGGGGGGELAQISAEGLVNVAGGGGLGELIMKSLGLDNVQMPNFQPLIDLLEGGFEQLKDIIEPVLTNNIGPGLQDLGNGLKGFIDNLSGTDAGIFETVGQGLVLLGGALATMLTGMVAAGGEMLGDLMSGIGAALPDIGAGLNDVITALSLAAGGDPGAALIKLGEGVGSFISAIGGFSGPIADELIEALEQITGLDFPSVEEGLSAFKQGFEDAGKALEIIFDNIKRGLERFFLGAKITIMGGIEDLRQEIINLTTGSALGTVDIAPNIDVDLRNAKLELAGMDLADVITEALGAQSAAGNIDMSQIVRSGMIQLPLGEMIEIVPDEAFGVRGRDAIVEALQTAVMTGDTEAFSALVPLAMELDIPIDPLIEQMRDITLMAGAAERYRATATADVTVVPGRIIVDALRVAVMSGIASIGTGGSGGGGGAGHGAQVPIFAEGGVMPYTGLAHLEAGERVLNPEESRNYNGGGRGGGNTYHVTIYGESPYDLYRVLEQARRDNE